MKIPKKFEHLPRHDFRDAVFGAIEEIMQGDTSAILLTNDMGAVGLDRIAQFAPERVINVGITEQNMMSVASGLALSGHRVFVYGIISHIIFRAFEQIKLDICVQNLPIVLVGVGAGLAYGMDGPTHHGTEDIAVLRALPNISIYNPCDCASARECVINAYRGTTPSFVRMDKETLPDILDYEALDQSGVRMIGDAGDGLIVATGVSVWQALLAQERLAAENIKVQVLDVIRPKPLAVEAIRKICKDKKWIAVIEENVSLGGIHELIARAIIGKSLQFFLSFSLGDKYILGSAKREWAWDAYDLNSDSIVESILSKLSERISFADA